MKIIEYRTECGMVVSAKPGGEFTMYANGRDSLFSRSQLEDLRVAIDTALNTSAEELDA